MGYNKPTVKVAKVHWERASVPSGSLLEEFREFAAFLEKTPGFFVVAFSIVYFAGTLGAVIHRKLWADEIVSRYISTLPTIGGIWAALRDAVDGNPPLYYLITRPFLLIWDGDIAIRLPAVIGFWVAAICVFIFVRRNTSALAGAIATLLFAESGASYWASEGRPYGPALGLTGIALVLWQRCTLTSKQRLSGLLGLGLAMASLVSTHYYGLLVAIPLLAGELARTVVNKRLDWPLCSTIVAGSAAILGWLPLIQGLRHNIAANGASKDYFAQPTLGSLYNAYQGLAAPIIVPVLFCLCISYVIARHGRNEFESVETQPWGHEIAVASGLVFLPAIALAIALLVTHTLVTRYVLATALGIGILGGMLVHRTLGRERAVMVVGFLVMFSSFSSLYLPSMFEKDETYDAALASLGSTDPQTPIVVTEALEFLPLAHLSPEALRSRMFYLTDLETARGATDPTAENMMLLLKRFAPQTIVNLDQFISGHKNFLLYYTGTFPNSSLNAVLARKCKVALAKKDRGALLFSCDCTRR
jgi:hypothetical protein